MIVVDIHLRSGTTLPTPKPPLITKISDIPAGSKPPVAKMVDPTNVTIPTQTQPEVEPPFPEKLIQNKLEQIEEQPFDIFDQLKNIHVQIPLFQAIKDVPIYGKAIREICLKNPRIKKNDPTIVHVVGQLVDIMLGKVITPKYSDLGSLVVNVSINGQFVKNALIDLGATINVMSKDIMKKLQIEGLRPTPTIL